MSSSTQGSKHSRTARRFRRAVRGLGWFVLALVAILVLIPLLLCSRPAERAISRAASKALGRPVEYSGLRFGLTTLVRLDRLALPAIEGEPRPLLELRNLAVPVPLAGFCRRPPYAFALTLGHLELNVIRTAAGTLNIDGLGGAAAAQTNPPPREPAAAWPILPLARLRLAVDRIDIRYLDVPRPLAAGWEGGRLALDWPGPGQPLQLDLGGGLRLNDTNVPWAVHLAVADWTAPDGRLTPETARLAIDCGEGDAALLCARASAVAGTDSTVRVRIPLAGAASLAKALLPTNPVPGVAGTLAVDIAARHGGGFSNWTVQAGVNLPDLAVDDPAGRSAAAAAGITLAATVALPPPGPAGAPAGPLTVAGELATRIDTLEAAAGELGATLAGFTDTRTFQLRVGGAEALSYTDTAATRLKSVETTTGTAVNDVFLDAKAFYGANVPVTYGITRAGVSNLAVRTPAVTLTLPPVGFRGGLAADLARCTASLQGGRLEVGSCVAGDLPALQFGWTNNQIAVEADLAIRSLADLLAMVQVHGAAAKSIPAATGALRFRAGLRGVLPKGIPAPGAPLPLTGALSLALDGVGLDGGRQYRVEGIDSRVDVSIPADGSAVSNAFRLTVASVQLPAGPALPLQELRVEMDTVLRGLDELNTALVVGLAGTRTACSVQGTASGLAACLSGGVKNPADLLRQVRFAGAVHAEQDLGGLAGLAPGLTGEGLIVVDSTLTHQPGRRTQVAFGLKARQARIGLGDSVRVGAIDGEWALSKTLEPAGSGRRPGAPAPRGIGIEVIEVTTPKVALNIRQASLDLSGIDQGLQASLEVADLLGGPAAGRFTLATRDGNPEVSGRLTLTGLNGDALLPGGTGHDDRRRAADINAVADFRWLLPAGARGTALDHLKLQVKSIRIGKEALIRILQALDEKQDTPQFQSAIAALSLGTPTGLELRLENSLVTLRSELLFAGGIRRPLPILDASPLGDLAGVYGLDRADASLARLRGAILLLLAENLDEFKATWEAMPK